ncbi:hypothetical protein CGCF415_v003993 [Colletotrichum fructicola]|nr:hypothetical protein CGCF415_v003993 [Colletotrichum fructicola]KAF4939454.1 hypothetical protein CGCF245_v003575 [Colletotrichum fructicola]
MTHGISTQEAAEDFDGANDSASPFDGGGYISDTSRGARLVLQSEQRRVDMEGPEINIPNDGPPRRFSCNSLVGSSMTTPQTALSMIGKDWLDHYTNIYFRHVQPQWTFIDEVAWRDAYATHSSSLSEAATCHHFVIQMVLAIGALVSSSFRADCPHLVHASRLHDEAMNRNLGNVTGHSSPLIRTQASLLMLLYAFHGPSPDPVSGSVMLVLMNCANLMDDKHEVDLYAGNLCVDFEHTRNMTIMSSHILNEVVASAWTYPQPFMFEILDEKIFQHASQMPAGETETGFYSHIFQLRCIQSKIRHFNKKLQKLDPSDPFRETSRLRLKDELQLWKEKIEAVTNSSPKDDLVYHEPSSLSKLYDYSLSILVQERPCMMGHEEVGQLVECCSEACRTFLSSQENDSVIYRTWTALMYQFRLGIILLYCYAMTPPLLRTANFSLPDTISGFECCHRTMEKFSIRWPRALVFLQSFQLLAESVFDGPAFGGQACNSNMLDSPSSQSLCSPYALEGERKTRMQSYIVELRVQHVHQAVISLMEEMLNRPQHQDLNYEGLDLLPNMSIAGFDLFNF